MSSYISAKAEAIYCCVLFSWQKNWLSTWQFIYSSNINEEERKPLICQDQNYSNMRYNSKNKMKELYSKT